VIHSAFHSPLSSMFDWSEDGIVPDHGFTTLIGPLFQGSRVVLSLLWHGPVNVEMRESVITPDGQCRMVRSQSPDALEFVNMMLAYHLSMPDFQFDVPFTSPDVGDHVDFLAELGINIPQNHEHWHNRCMPAAQSHGLHIHSPNPSSDWSDVHQAFGGSTAKPTGAGLKGSYLLINPSLGESEYINLKQSVPSGHGRQIYFFSKRVSGDNIEFVVVGHDTQSGSEVEIYRRTIHHTEVDKLLQMVSRNLFKTGESWVQNEAA
jgi:hypothetical protein